MYNNYLGDYLLEPKIDKEVKCLIW